MNPFRADEYSLGKSMIICILKIQNLDELLKIMYPCSDDIKGQKDLPEGILDESAKQAFYYKGKN